MKKFTIGGALLLCTVVVSGCGLQPPPITTALWADVHPQGWVVFTGSRPPFPPPTQPYGYDDKLLLYHPHLGTVITLLEDASDTFSWPRWDATPYADRLYWIGEQQRVYRLVVDFAEIERAISNPLDSQLPFSLEDAELLWTDKEGEISTLAPSPDGRLLAFLREYQGQFSVVVLDEGEKIAELPTAWMPQVIWTSDGRAVLLAQEDPDRSVSVGDQQLPVGTIMRHEIATGEETALVKDVVLYHQIHGGNGLGPVALAPDGGTLYYTNLVTLRPRTALEFRLGLYRVDLERGARQLVMELPVEQVLNELVVSPDGRRVAFTLVSYRAGAGLSVQSSLLVYHESTGSIKELARLVNGWLFPLWLDDTYLAYAQFQMELEHETLPMGVQPALWVYNVETGERYNHLPLLTMHTQIESLRRALRQLQERVTLLEQAVQKLQGGQPPQAP